MPASRSRRIIAKLDWKLAAILSFAAFLRLFNAFELTEFLGDQGRTLLILDTWVKQGAMPLVGPTTLSGHHLGPVFYYLLFPVYAIYQSPEAVVFWVAVLGVAAVFLLYKTVYVSYGPFAGVIVSLLYAVSPAIVKQDRIIWEPNLVPIFGFAYVWLFMRQHDRVSFPVVFLQGVVCSILLQLHYPNLFLIALFGCIAVGHSLRTGIWSYIPSAAFWWLVGFVAGLAPFLYYEFGQGFRDLTGIVQVFFHGGVSLGKRQWLLYSLDYAHRIVGMMLPGISVNGLLALLIGWIVFLVRHLTSFNILWTFWFVAGSLAMGRYNGVVFDHYLYYLLPVPFFMLASVLSSVSGRLLKSAVFVMFAGIAAFRFFQTDVLTRGNYDIPRVRAQVAKAHAYVGDDPYAFTLVSSRSYSDLHYRYFMKTSGFVPQDISTDAYSTLVIFCDSNSCAQADEILSRGTVPVLCYDHHCSGQYPQIVFSEWMYDRYVAVESGYYGGFFVFSRPESKRP